MKYNIAFGERLVQALDEEDYEKAAKDIDNRVGDIVGYDSETDHIQDLLEHAMGNNYYSFVSDEVLEKINELINP